MNLEPRIVFKDMEQTESQNTNKELTARLEALLFIYGESLAVRKIAGILNISEAETENAIAALDSELKQENRGLFLIRDQEKVQLSTKPTFGGLLDNIVKEEFKESLSPASLETLSIVLYANPISRAEIDFIRGVNSTFILRSLLIRGLVDRESDPERSNVYLYKPSFELLKYLGISKTEDLPEYQRFQALMENMRKEPKEKPAETPIAKQ